MNIDYKFFIIGSAHHHLYYLIPYIEATENKECCLINSPSKYTEVVRREFQGINFRSYRHDDENLVRYLNQSNFLICANAYVLFEKRIKAKISESVVFVYVTHGVWGKFTDKGYIASWLLGDIVVFNGKKDLDLVYHTFGYSVGERLYGRSLFLEMADGRRIQVILSGNLRVQDYLKKEPRPRSFLGKFSAFNPGWKTVLYIPTYSYNPSRTDSTFSSIPFFVKMLKEGVIPDKYNYIIKLHPNMILEKKLLDELVFALKNSNLRFFLDIFGNNYLPYMDFCDLMITDRTSAFYDFLYFDKPVIFLDHNGECPEKIDFEDIANTYWSYQCGPVVSEQDISRLREIIEEVLENDSYKEIRKKVKEYVFFDGVTPRDVLVEMLKHPKFKKGNLH